VPSAVIVGMIVRLFPVGESRRAIGAYSFVGGGASLGLVLGGS
jgi:hypothetical protein